MQRSNEWHNLRSGKFTASEIHKIMGKSINTDTAMSYIYEKVAQQLTGERNEFDNAAVRWGAETEPFAKQYYEAAFSEKIVECDFFPYGKFNDNAGFSPDGILVGKKKGIEIKCPFNSANHVKYLSIRTQEEFKIECKEYYWQIMMCIAGMEFIAWDFVTFDPRFTGSLRMQALEIKPDDKDILLLETRINQAIEIKNEILTKINF